MRELGEHKIDFRYVTIHAVCQSLVNPQKLNPTFV